MSGFQIGGLASGLDTQALIDAIMATERRPVDRLNARRLIVEQRRTALADIKSRLATLQFKAADLSLSSAVNAKSASSAVTTILTATANPSAALGVHNVTVTQLATATKAASTSVIGNAIDQLASLDSAGFATTPTNGTFTINGVEISVTDVTTQSLEDVRLTINAAGAGVTATITNDAANRPNVLTLTADSGTQIQLGSAGDTSNFLTVTKVLGVEPSGNPGVINSQGNLGTTSPSLALSAGRITDLTAASGTFTINNVEIAWADTESLNTIISRINGAGARVTASYDSIQDRLIITSGSTGSQLIDLEDTAGDFLAAMKVTAPAAQAAGKNAVFTIDTVNGGAQLSSATNTVSGMVAGMTFTLKQLGSSAVTVAQDTAATVTAVKAFVDQFNSSLTLIRDKMKYNSSTKKSEVLTGDRGLQRVESTLRRLVVDRFTGATAADPYQSLMDLGISFGAVGSAPGTTTSLVLNETKLTAALTNNPEAVANVFRVLEGDTRVGVAHRLNNFLKEVTGVDGFFKTSDEGGAGELKRIADTVAALERRLVDRRLALQRRFTTLETALSTLQGQQATLAAQLAQAGNR